MKELYLFSFFLLIVFNSLGQKKEIEFYSYLQHKITKELKYNDSLIIDQFSDKDEKYNWQAIIKATDDSCIVIFLPPQYSQDTMVLPGELTIINKFTISKLDLVDAFEQAKDDLKHDRIKSQDLVEVSISYFDKRKEFNLRKVQELYYRLRYNKSSWLFDK